MATKKDIERLIGFIAKEANLPTTKDEAIEQNKPQYLSYNCNNYYGGYELILIRVEGGGQSGAFNKGCGRLKAGVFYEYLQGLYGGLTFKK